MITGTVRWQDSNGNVYVPSLDWNDDERYLNLYYLENDFNPNYRFLVSRQHLH